MHDLSRRQLFARAIVDDAITRPFQWALRGLAQERRGLALAAGVGAGRRGDAAYRSPNNQAAV